jgi:soluble lytic murein transglycosylase-like protein
VEITGLDITLRRIQAIESGFKALSNGNAAGVDLDFRKILDASISKQLSNGGVSDSQAPLKSTEDKAFSTFSKAADSSEIDGLIESYSLKNNLDTNFVKAVIKQESGFQKEATSHCGAMGLMQLMPATASSLGVKNAFDPEENIAGGTRYLSGLLERFGGNKELALAAYNAGPEAVQRHGGIPPYKETRNYVKNVLSHYNNYKAGGQS